MRYGKDKLIELSEAYFDQYPDADFFYATTDNNFFLPGKENACKNHCHSAKVTCYKISRDDLVKAHLAAEKAEYNKAEAERKAAEEKAAAEKANAQLPMALEEFDKLHYTKKVKFINTLESVDFINAYLADETAATVTKAGEIRIEELQKSKA